MTQKLKHTPFRLEIKKPKGRYPGYICIRDRERDIIHESQGVHSTKFLKQKERAEFITRACDNHYDLLEVLEIVVNDFHLQPKSALNSPSCKWTIDKIKTVLQKAKGEE